jgi:hypothetical protein
VLISLLGYFFYVVTAFTAAMALLISFDDSRLISHHNRPAATVTLAAVATQSENQRLPAATEGQSAKYVSAKDVTSSLAVAKAEMKTAKGPGKIGLAKELTKNERRRLAHLDALKVLARFGPTRGSPEGHHFRIALGYAEGSGYRPGLDSQR